LNDRTPQTPVGAGFWRDWTIVGASGSEKTDHQPISVDVFEQLYRNARLGFRRSTVGGILSPRGGGHGGTSRD